MIRFIDLRGQVPDMRFAFWNTDTERFCCFNGTQAWHIYTDFLDDFTTHVKDYEPGKEYAIGDFTSQMPEWASRTGPQHV